MKITLTMTINGNDLERAQQIGSTLESVASYMGDNIEVTIEEF